MQASEGRALTVEGLRRELDEFMRQVLSPELDALRARIVRELARADESRKGQPRSEGRLGQPLSEEAADEVEEVRRDHVPLLGVSKLQYEQQGGNGQVGGRSARYSSREMQSVRDKSRDTTPIVSPRVAPRDASVESSSSSKRDRWRRVRSTSPSNGAAAPLVQDLPRDVRRKPSEIDSRGALERMVKGNSFEVAASCLVMASVVWLTVQTHCMAIWWLSEPPSYFEWIEHAFCALFLLELVLRIGVDGFSGYFCDGDSPRMNTFDFVLVACQVLDNVLLAMKASRIAGADLLRILRLFRLMRMVRIFRHFPDLRLLIVSVFQSMRPLMWVFALIFFITTVFAVIITMFVTEYKTAFDRAEFGLEDPKMALMEEYFGALDKTILALYGTIAGGRDWHTSSAPLQLISPYMIFLFVTYTFVTIFAMMNVVTSQFVDSALEASSKDRRESMVNSLMESFAHTKGLVTEGDFMGKLEDKSMKTFLKDLYKREEVSADEIRSSRLFEMLDDDDSGAITREELVLGCVKLTGSATALDLAVLKLDVHQIRRMLTALMPTDFRASQSMAVYAQR